ncbi:hypothetical protein B0T26DRAFT_656040 [Lasiosphaeria miniovina]|uniref:Uncharacterized protein n=1 Tax=Lasiosphaeria miniovina TaxID=1954250 RepID=A0AA40DMQ1_9PEZI|nr:uncharacterized protein B0T26DRAFT_656040 [Lasiosphaeria miniovina]KAK0706507.1 hypothetical protein B0T26DRAFT_656040 [Lasiosphaeria miniovina]
MSSDDLSAALKFLSDAGHLLASASPEISASIMSHRNSLMFENELAQPDTERQRVCGCCGYIMILGHGSSLDMRHEKAAKTKLRSLAGGKRKEARVQEPRFGPTKVLTCGHCGRLTEVKLPAPRRIARRTARTPKAGKPGPPLSTSAPPQLQPVQDIAPSLKSNANANSKKRAKTRKAGLQALLDQASSSRNSKLGLGLSLADFMEK